MRSRITSLNGAFAAACTVFPPYLTGYHVKTIVNGRVTVPYTRGGYLILTSGIVNTYNMVPFENIGSQAVTDRRRESRAKRHPGWERLEIDSNGRYAEYVRHIASSCPGLTRSELRVCDLVKAMYNSIEIARALGIDERTVENHRTSARRKLGLSGCSLTQHLSQLS
jgi:DNA-binding CsgD family transcriptional regulator